MTDAPDVEAAGKRQPITRGPAPRSHSEAGLRNLWQRYLAFREECEALEYTRGDPRAAELWREHYRS